MKIVKNVKNYEKCEKFEIKKIYLFWGAFIWALSRMVGLLVVAPLFLVWPMVSAVPGCMGILCLSFFCENPVHNDRIQNLASWLSPNISKFGFRV